MKVFLFHPVLLPPKNYGGVERVVLWLAQGLRNQGHEVWVGAQEGSVLPKGIHGVFFDRESHSAEAMLKKLPRGLDVVHFMAPPEQETWKRLPCFGILTVHGNGKVGEKFHPNTVFLSRDHAERHHSQVYVWNGIDPAEFQFNPNSDSRKRYLFLSKTSWSVKNLKGAIHFAESSGVELAIAGGNRPLGLRLKSFFSQKLFWEGPVSGERKAELLSSARALVFPVVWPEPFGLVVAESLMSGTPVLASRLGSLPELIPETVGRIFSSPSEWIEFLSEDRIPWSPEACRNWAEKNFHFEIMAQKYEKLYERVVAGELLSSNSPYT